MSYNQIFMVHRLHICSSSVTRMTQNRCTCEQQLILSPKGAVVDPVPYLTWAARSSVIGHQVFLNIGHQVFLNIEG